MLFGIHKNVWLILTIIFAVNWIAINVGVGGVPYVGAMILIALWWLPLMAYNACLKAQESDTQTYTIKSG